MPTRMAAPHAVRCTAGALAVCLIVCLTLAGCATPPRSPAVADTPAAAATLPTTWQGRAPAVSSASGPWWAGFDDPLLDELVTAALAANLDLQTARLSLQRARALRDVAAAAEGPSVGVGASAGRSRSGGSAGNSLRTGLDASWEVDLFGANASATAAAAADRDAAAATLQATRLSVAAETALAYLQWQGARAQVAVAAASLDSQQRTLDAVGWRQRSGLASGLDLEQAATGVDSARARLAQLRLAQSQSEHALSLLTGRPPAAWADRLAAAPPREATAPDLPALPQPAALLQRRWDLQAAEHRITTQLATLQQRQAERRPQFTLSGNVALQAATLSALGGSGALVAALAASIDWPLFDGGAGAARVEAEQAALASARVAWQSAVHVALQDVEDGLAAAARQRERVDALTQASARADEALRLARIGYDAGLTDLITLLDAERTALSAGDARAAARTELAQAHVRLFKAIGGDWRDTPLARTPSSATP